MTDYRKHFHEMRHDPRFHVGSGDIRITVAMQDEIVEEVERLRGLLREARDVIQTAYEEAGGFWYKAEKLFPRIDAALDTNSAANRVMSPIADKTVGECPERATIADRRQEDGCS